MTTNETPVDLNQLVPMAFVIDGEVVLIMHTNEKIAAVLQSDPIAIQFTRTGTDADPRVGDVWDGNNFIKKSE